MKVLVNLITCSRFIYTLFLPHLQTQISNQAFIINLIILYLTDTVDGFLARTFKVQTFFGSIMDTIADKTLSIVLLIILFNNIEIFSVVLMIEFLIAIINSIALITGKRVKTIIVGKVKTWFLAGTIVLGYMYYFNIISFNIVYCITLVTVALQVLTFVEYTKYLDSVKDNPRDKQKIRRPRDLKYVLFDTDYYMKSCK